MLVLLLLLACKPDVGDSAAPGDTGFGPRGDCNPVQPEHCLLPYPSTFYLEADGDSPTGHRLAFGPESLPENEQGERTRPEAWNRLDGYSALGPLLAYLPGTREEQLCTRSRVAETLDPAACTTLLLDAETGQPVAHWAELDSRVGGDERAALVLRPAAALEPAHRYVVAVHGLLDGGGAPLPPPEGFRQLRDGEDSGEPDLERQRAHYEDDIFPLLEAAGLERGELQLAWDFVTASREAVESDALWMRDDALAWFEEQGGDYEVQAYSGNCALGDEIALTLTGSFTAPLYLESDEPGALLARDGDGHPLRSGTTEVPFVLRVPCSVYGGGHAPAQVVQYGHGLFGNRNEVYGYYLADMAQAQGWLLLATDWRGMDDDSVLAVTGMMGDGLSDFSMIPDATLQAYVEALLAERLLRGPLAADPLLQPDGRQLVDADAPVLFYGNSQGAILGGGYAAFNPDISRAALGVVGTPFSLLLTRSHYFDAFLAVLESSYADPLDISVLFALMQGLWDPGEVAGWTPVLAGSERLPGQSWDKRVLLQDAIGDAGVSTLGAQVLARSVGAVTLEPAPRAIYGIEEVPGPAAANALAEYDFGIEEPEGAEPPPAETDPHNSLRVVDEAEQQVWHFLATGEAENFCDGVCDPH